MDTTLTNAKSRPTWSRRRSIGDYGGSLDKRDSETEGLAPYAATVYTMIQSMRGSAFTQNTGTLVHVENLALARFWSTLAFRYPEKVRANATPAGADEKLSYWVQVLGIPRKDDDPDWAVRERCVAHFRAANGPTYPIVLQAVTDLLGDKFVGLVLSTGTDLENPPAITYWPGVNPGPTSYDLGHGAWFSERAHVAVVVGDQFAHDATNSDLLNVQLFRLLDELLPAKCTFNWTTTTGFLLDVSDLDFDGVGP
jgi:hypothetical protein